MYTLKTKNILDGSEEINTFENIDSLNIVKNERFGDSNKYENIVEENIEPISARKIKFSLRLIGITEDMVIQAINTVQDELQRDLAMIAWKDSDSFIFTEPACATIGALLGLTEEQRKQVWIKGKDL